VKDAFESRGLVGLAGAVHGKLVFGRRIRILAQHLAELIPPGSRVLDIGCGDGSLGLLISQKVPRLTVTGIDVLVRPNCHIPVQPFDGFNVPYADDSFDIAIFVDVLHHTRDPIVLMREAARVAPTIVIKDHTRTGFLAGPTLRFMDWVGNAPHGVVLPYNYWTKEQWNAALSELRLRTIQRETKLRLYPPPASWFFDRNLHFVAKWQRIAKPPAVR
jgi:SAM-dependent methyltransferase